MADEISPDQLPLSLDPVEPALSRSGSSSRLNARAPEFVPRGAAPPPPPPPVMPVIHVFGPPPPPGPPAPPYFAAPPPPYEYFAAAASVPTSFGPEHEIVEAENPSPPPQQPAPASGGKDGISDDVVHKITKQVEYYFSDINLATTEHLMRFIMKDPEGYVPISVISSFKKIKALVHNNSMLATALRTSSKLIVSDDGKRVKRLHPFTESDMEELQSRIVVAENLPEDHCYQNLMKLFSAAASVKTIRTCYPQTPNGSAPVTNRSAKLDMLFSNKLHAFVEYGSVEDAGKAIAELNDARNWRTGLRVRLLNTCLTKGVGRGKRGGNDGDGNGEEEDVSTSSQPNEKQVEDISQLEASHEHVAEEGSNDKDAGGKRGKGRGRGGRGRGRGQQHHHNNHHQNNNHHHGGNRGTGGHHPMGTPPSSQSTAHPAHHEQLPIGVSKQPPGPRMPDGTRGFTLGRGKPQASSPSLLAK